MNGRDRFTIIYMSSVMIRVLYIKYGSFPICTVRCSSLADALNWWEGVGGGLQPPSILEGGGVEFLSTPPDFERILFNCPHMLLCTDYGSWLPLN